MSYKHEVDGPIPSRRTKMKITKNNKFAELIGMILGDGNLGNYPSHNKTKSILPRCQYLRIYCNIKEEQYANEIEKILNYIFNKKCYKYKRPSEGIIYLEISGKNLNTYLDIPIGDKIKNQVKIPNWIFLNKNYLISCLRGLFDTDGCCYLTGNKYRIINFTNKNKILLENIVRSLIILGFHPYTSGGRNVELGRQMEVDKFFSIIQPKNIKHYRYNAEVANVVTAGV
jgi:intein/homing endonuclease